MGSIATEQNSLFGQIASEEEKRKIKGKKIKGSIGQRMGKIV
jgi:hypothetical protein